MSASDFFKKLLGEQSQTPDHFINTGSTGTEVFSGHFNEDYLPKFLQMPEGIKIYDEMRRSDYQIQMLLSAVKNPIIGASWGVEPVDDSDEEKEIAEFIEHCLFEDISYPDNSKRKTWRAFLEEVLTSMEFGYALFEPVYKVVMEHERWGNYIGLRDIAFRSQKTIYEWNLNPNGSIKNVRQLANGDLRVDVKIPGENLIVFSVNKEGDNYEGISMIRSLYGNWFRKNAYYKIQAMGIERCATGVLVGRVPVSAQSDLEQLSRFKDMLRKFTSHQSNYMMLPEGFEINVSKIDFDSQAVETSIDNEDKRMAKSFLAGFLELGLSGKGGSEALSKDLSNIFLNGIEIYSEKIADIVGSTVVKKLVDAKFGKRAKYCKLKAGDINEKASKETAEIASILKNSGIIRDSDQLEDALNRMFGFPVISQEQKEKSDTEGRGRGANAASALFSESVTFADSDNPTIFIRQRSASIKSLMHDELTVRTEEYLKKMQRQLNDTKDPVKRRKILKDSVIPGKSDYKRKVRLLGAQMTEEATSRVLKELKMPNVKFDEFAKILKDVPRSVKEKLRITVDEIVDEQDNELHKRMFFIASQKLDTTDSVDSLVADMRKAKDKYITGALTTVATNMVSGTVNTARNAVFQTPEVFEEIDSFIIDNPSPTAAICKNLVGRVFSKDEYLVADLPPYHHNCETTVKAQLKGQKNIKKVNPIGLTPTGDEKEVLEIMKSKTF